MRQDLFTSYALFSLQAADVDFDKLIAFDNKCFISSDNPIRREFLRLWTSIPDGVTYVALSSPSTSGDGSGSGGDVIGFGCCRPCIQPDSHQVGPLYAESGAVAEALLQRLCADVTGKDITVNIW